MSVAKSFVIAVVSIVVGVALWNFYNVNIADPRILYLGGEKFAIPRRFIAEQPPLWMMLDPRLDGGSDDFLLKIDANEVARDVLGYQSMTEKFVADIHIRLEVDANGGIEGYKHPSHLRAMWENTGRFEQMTIGAEPGTGFVRVYDKFNSPWYWEVLTTAPGTAPLP